MAKKKRKKNKPKKDAQLVLRLNSDLRDRFVDACEDVDTSAAREDFGYEPRISIAEGLRILSEEGL